MLATSWCGGRSVAERTRARRTHFVSHVDRRFADNSAQLADLRRIGDAQTKDRVSTEPRSPQLGQDVALGGVNELRAGPSEGGRASMVGQEASPTVGIKPLSFGSGGSSRGVWALGPDAAGAYIQRRAVIQAPISATALRACHDVAHAQLLLADIAADVTPRLADQTPVAGLDMVNMLVDLSLPYPYACNRPW